MPDSLAERIAVIERRETETEEYRKELASVLRELRLEIAGLVALQAQAVGGLRVLLALGGVAIAIATFGKSAILALLGAAEHGGGRP